ncbi:NahK/ErcS family hybrid sensor histidine kinase/response regulator [Azospirillum picis]|uniref:histidine kinase n=1 Tax=Azospirillum picis TaxID=488438 RepID=A0ABU0ME19_9PROT|nr:NahK/ErcS family hybrid sensor histidine kinase/response regulator [Azospirillum picis]MBP2297466.1 signal transduction histidine kinase [Azospirillum picis]MDQ0531511.1 signal transduction histidine kinase [Azospirillum picis]
MSGIPPHHHPTRSPPPRTPVTASPADRIAELERENAKLQRINKVLMDRVERSMDFQGGAFSLFQTAIVLEQKIRERTLELERALHKLEDSNRDHARAKELAETMRTRLFEAIESVNEGFALFDSADRLVLCNRKYLSYWPAVAGRIQAGIRFNDLVAMVAAAGAVSEPPPDVWLRERMEHRHDLKGVFLNRLADGRWIQVNERRTRDGGIVGVYTDITVIKREEERRRESEQAEKSALMLLNDQLQQAKAEADRANLSKTRFIAAASHDLLQPLNAARLFVSALADLEQPDANAELVENIDVALASVEDLLSALLDISKLDAGAVTPEVTDFPLRGILAPLATEYAAVAAERGIDLKVVGSGAVVRSDMRLLRRIVQNFLSNALRYVQGGRVVVGCRRVGDGIRIEVWDNGPGIPRDKIAEIFQEFRRLDTPVTKGRDRGMGLGLAIVDRVARMLDHPITVRSEPGRGSVFAVTVPRGTERRAARPASVASRPMANRLAGTSVLVLDNEPAVVAGMEALLRGWACDVVSATSGDQALALLSGMPQPPDLLIADYHLDDGALGVNEVARLRAACGRILPAVIVTANRTPELADEAKAAGCLVLNKPVKPAQLRAVMSGLVG